MHRWFCLNKNTVRSAFSLYCNVMIYNTVLFIREPSKRGDPGAQPAGAPPNPLFLPHFCGRHIYRRAGCHSNPWHRTSARSHRKAALLDGKAGCWDCTDKKKHLRRKSPPLFTLFLFIIIIIQYKEKEPWHNLSYLRSWAAFTFAFHAASMCS